MAFEAGREVESIYKTMYETDGSEIYLLDMLGNEGESEEILDKMLLETLLNHVLGMSQVQVSRMEKKVLLRMRKEAVGYKV